jgi:alpha-N-arabinofuranosidase
MVFLGTRPVGYPRYHILGRETFLTPVTWKDGWPIVGNNSTVDLEMEGPLSTPQTWDSVEPLRNDFNDPELGLHWNWLRNPVLENYSTSKNPGWLRLMGTEATLDDKASPTFLGRRQRLFNCRVSTLLDFTPQAENEEAGLVVLADNRHHYEIGITQKAGQRSVIVRCRIGTLQAILAHQPISDGFITLNIVADKSWYSFSYSVGGEPLKELAKGETRYLCTEAGAAVFTSTYFGMYASGNGKPCLTPADFDFFQIEMDH